MKTIQDIINNYEQYETFLDDRFGKRLCNFLTIEQAKQIGFIFEEGHQYNHIPKEWNEANIIEQLTKDVQFGWEKACDERGISASLMYYVVKTWCQVLENEFADFDDANYYPYGKPLFKAVAKKYNIYLFPKE